MSQCCGGGRFARDSRGVWRYGEDGQPVSGAQDMTLTNLFNFPMEQGVVSVLRGMAIENEILSWCLEYDTEVGATIEIPLPVWSTHDRVIGIWAPELMQEGGIRGLQFDEPTQPLGIHGVSNSPVAPTKRADIKRTSFVLERDLRRKGWVPQTSISNGTSAYWEHWRSEHPQLTLAQYLKGYRTAAEDA